MRYIGVISIIVLLLSIGLLSGCINVVNTPPEILIAYPENGSIIGDKILTLYAIVSDKDGDLLHITMSWRFNSSSNVTKVLDVWGYNGSYISRPLDLIGSNSAELFKHEIVWYLSVYDGTSYNNQTYKFYHVSVC